jgi:hypothetical protein
MWGKSLVVDADSFVVVGGKPSPTTLIASVAPDMINFKVVDKSKCHMNSEDDIRCDHPSIRKPSNIIKFSVVGLSN